METPTVQALLVCEQVLTDEATKRKTLVNLLNEIHGHSFPLTLPRLTVFATLSNGNGEMSCELRCARADNDEPIFGVKGPVRFPNPNATVEFVFELGNFTFPVPALYSFMLYCDDDLLAERRFTVTLATPPHLPFGPAHSPPP